MPKHTTASRPVADRLASDRHADLPHWMVAAYFAPPSSLSDGAPVTSPRDVNPAGAAVLQAASPDLAPPARTISRGGVDVLLNVLQQTWPQAGGDHVLPTGAASRNR